MGALERRRDRHTTLLSVQSRVGRALDSTLVVEHSLASSAHALIEWRPPGQWELRDLASRNGTFIDGVRLASGQWWALELGQRIAFGEQGDELLVVELERPPAEAHCVVSHERRVASEQILGLSEDPHDWVDVVEDGPGRWVVERNGDCKAAHDGQEVVVGDRRWRLVLPAGVPPTASLDPAAQPSAVTPRLEFHVSADLEHIEITVEFGPRREQTSRAYARGLLELARARLADQQCASIHADEHGWVYADELCSLAGYESESRLNVEVHRARREFARMGIPNAATMIQRRRGTQQLRIGTPALRIVDAGRPL